MSKAFLAEERLKSFIERTYHYWGCYVGSGGCDWNDFLSKAIITHYKIKKRYRLRKGFWKKWKLWGKWLE